MNCPDKRWWEQGATGTTGCIGPEGPIGVTNAGKNAVTADLSTLWSVEPLSNETLDRRLVLLEAQFSLISRAFEIVNERIEQFERLITANTAKAELGAPVASAGQTILRAGRRAEASARGLASSANGAEISRRNRYD